VACCYGGNSHELWMFKLCTGKVLWEIAKRCCVNGGMCTGEGKAQQSAAV
jgi:hypothetical protein